MPNSWEDPIVSEVRRIREWLAEQFGFDVEAIFADLQNRQAALGDRLVRHSRTTDLNNGGTHIAGMPEVKP